jgi:hypothetical protein
MTLNHDHAANNSGIFLVFEVVTPIVILLLAMYDRVATMEGKHRYD